MRHLLHGSAQRPPSLLNTNEHTISFVGKYRTTSPFGQDKVNTLKSASRRNLVQGRQEQMGRNDAEDIPGLRRAGGCAVAIGDCRSGGSERAWQVADAVRRDQGR